MNSSLSTPTRRWSRLSASAVIALTAPLVVAPAPAPASVEPAAVTTAPGPSEQRAGQAVWATYDPREPRADYGDVRRLRIVREGGRVYVTMRYWRGKNEFLPAFTGIDIDTGGGPKPEFDAFNSQYFPRRLDIYRQLPGRTDRRVCRVTTVTERSRSVRYPTFKADFPVRCLTPSGKGRPDRIRFRVMNSDENPQWNPPDIVPGRVLRNENQKRPWGPWLDATR
jgi:hypothetical protein